MIMFKRRWVPKHSEAIKQLKLMIGTRESAVWICKMKSFFELHSIWKDFTATIYNSWIKAPMQWIPRNSIPSRKIRLCTSYIWWISLWHIVLCGPKTTTNYSIQWNVKDLYHWWKKVHLEAMYQKSKEQLKGFCTCGYHFKLKKHAYLHKSIGLKKSKIKITLVHINGMFCIVF